MSTLWLVIALVAVASASIKAAGPVLVGGRTLPPRLNGVIAMLAPALLAALIVVQTASGDDRELVLDARAGGVAVAAAALALRAPMLIAVLLAPVTAALLRALT